jgi:hypothetical protein
MISFTLTEISKPAGTICVTVPPPVDSTVTVVFPFSPGSIAVILPATVEVKVVLLLFSPLGYTCPRPRLPPT